MFALLFVSLALYNRLELTITKDDAWHEARARERAAASLGALSALWDAWRAKARPGHVYGELEVVG